MVWFAQAVAILLTALVLGGCPLFSDDSGSSSSQSVTFEPIPGWSGSQYDEIAIVTGSRSVTVPDSYRGEELFFVVTNYGNTNREVSVPGLSTTSHSSSTADRGERRISRFSGIGASTYNDTQVQAIEKSTVTRGHPAVTAKNRESVRRLARFSDTSISTSDVPSSELPEIGTDQDFYYFDASGTSISRGSELTAKLIWKETDTDGDWSVLIWVDNNWLNGEEQVTEEMVVVLGERFLKDSDNQDIFGWVASVFGMPWGNHPYSNLISPTERAVHILLYDIDDKGIPGDTPQGRYGGLFWSGDNYVKGTGSNYEESSNERLMFYLNAALLAAGGNGDWDPNYFWPREVISTLAHEFQHMIQFYQRVVRRTPDGFYPVWLNELASLVAEDLVAKKLSIPGPRAVTAADAGSAGNLNGRMPWYNDLGSLLNLTTWSYSDPDVFGHYGISYSFGAFLARVYGADVMRVLLQQIPNEIDASYDRDAVYDRWAVAESVRRVSSTDLSFADLIRRWGISMLVSDDLSAPRQVRLNRGDWFESTAGGQTYELGSVNAYNYSFPEGGGLYHGPSFWPPGTAVVPAAANRFILPGTVPTGGVTLRFNLPSDVVVTILSRKN